MNPVVKRINNPPDAASLMLTARSFGKYDLAAAIADLIDNSIKAKSTLIDISCNFADGTPEVRIRDNGEGMSEDELLNAMRPACVNPSKERSPDDLGRFGWGMKSASFSQCKILTVVSKKDGQINAARWNLDDIDDWAMDTYKDDHASQLLSKRFEGNSGTELVWNKCDRLSEDFSINQDQFNELVMSARKKLSLIFHRYLAGEQDLKKIEINLNGTPLDRVDPFCTKHDATIPFNEEPINLAGGNKIRMTAYVLPHFSKLTSEEYETAGGEEGYVKNQGFYVYRNKRLIIHGTWFKLAQHGELSKLVRVRVDIPNSLDDMWKITVDKSDAQLPAALKSRMKDLIDRFRTTSTRVFRSKGARIDNPAADSIWKKYVRNEKINYFIDKEHPLIKAFVRPLGEDTRRHLFSILRLIETQMPLDLMFADISAKPRDVAQAFTSREELHETFRTTIPLLMAECGDIAELLGLLKRPNHIVPTGP